jgi:WD40 repeat protein
MEVGEAVEPLSVITHIGMSSFYPIDRLGKEIEGGPFIVSVGKDRDVRINYFIPPESEDDDSNDDEEEESKITTKLGSSRKVSPVKKQSNTKNQKLNDSMSINSDDQELAIGIRRILPGYDRDGHEGHQDKILEVRVVFVKGVTYIITSSEDLMVKRFDATDEKLLKVKTYKGCHKEFINCLDVIPEWQDYNYILSGSYDGLLCLWNWDNTEVPLIKYQHTKKLFCMYRFQDIVVTGCGMEIWVWNVFKGDIKYKITTKHRRPVTSITVVKGDYDIRMISASDDRTICIFNLINGTFF